MDEELSVGHLLLFEYKKLKEEQLARISTRDNLIYVTLASLGGVIVATLQAGQPAFLLVTAPACIVLGWTYLVNDEKVSAIGRHIRTVLTPQLETVLRSDIRLLTWENRHRSDRRRRLRKVGQLAVDLMTFCVPGLVGAITYVVTGSRGPALTTTAVAEMVAVLSLGVVIALHADLRRDAPLDPVLGSPPAGGIGVLPGR